MTRLGHALTAITFVVSFVFSYGAETGRMSLPSALAISAAATGAVWLSGRRPVAALGVVGALTLTLPVIGSTFAVMDLVVVFVVFQAVRDGVGPRAVAVVCLAALTIDDAWQRTIDGQGFVDPSVLYPLLLTAFSVGLGLQSRQLRRQRDELLALRDADRRRAVSDERRRIARDLHDAAAHHLSALVVRNKLARRVDTTDALRDAAAFTATTSTHTLDSLRQIVHVLNTEGDAPMDPAPRLSDIDAVVATMQAGGLEIERTSPAPTPVGGEVDVAVVRIVGEALANVLRHRGPGRCWLDIDRGHDAITLTVEDDGPSAWPPEAAAPDWNRPGRYGLTGMRERAQSCGGRLTVGPSPRGGWRVSAVLPVP